MHLMACQILADHASDIDLTNGNGKYANDMH
jgi:hypothetical protein